MNTKFEALKRELFMAGQEAIEGFTGHALPADWEKDTADRMMDEVYEQMSEKELSKFYETYGVSSQLRRMMFTLVCDREIPEKDNPYYISPGGYELANGKRFDFFRSEGSVNPENRTEVAFIVSELDNTYSAVITKEDVSQPFHEFFIFTGEYDEPQLGIKEVKDVSFEVLEHGETKEIHATKAQLESINADVQARYQEFLDSQKESELEER